MMRRIGDVAIALVVLVALWLGWLAIARLKDTGAVAEAFRSAAHNPYGNETPDLLEAHFAPGASLISVQETMRTSGFDCRVSSLSGPVLMICQRNGNGGNLSFLCERVWQAEFLFAPVARLLTKLRAEARGEC